MIARMLMMINLMAGFVLGGVSLFWLCRLMAHFPKARQPSLTLAQWSPYYQSWVIVRVEGVSDGR